MSIPKKGTAGKKKIVKKQKEILVAANKDNGFRLYLQQMNILSPEEFKAVISDPSKKSVMTGLYKDYLESLDPKDGIPF